MASRRAKQHAGTAIVLACCLVTALFVSLGGFGRDSSLRSAEFAARGRHDVRRSPRQVLTPPESNEPAVRAAAGWSDVGAATDADGDEAWLAAGAAPPPGRRSGRDAHSAFLEESVAGPDALDRRAAEALAEGVPDAERLAFVRARFARRTPGRLDGVLELPRSKTDLSTTKGESLEHALVRFLGDTAEEDPAARDMVRRIAFEEQPIASSVRVRAARAFARSAVGSDLLALRRHLAVETDSRLLAGALNGLAENPDADSARGVAEELGLTLPIRSEELEP